MIDIIKSQIRFPRSLRDWLKNTAKENSRSMNGELVEIVKKAQKKKEEESTKRKTT